LLLEQPLPTLTLNGVNSNAQIVHSQTTDDDDGHIVSFNAYEELHGNQLKRVAYHPSKEDDQVKGTKQYEAIYSRSIINNSRNLVAQPRPLDPEEIELEMSLLQGLEMEPEVNSSDDYCFDPEELTPVHLLDPDYQESATIDQPKVAAPDQPRVVDEPRPDHPIIHAFRIRHLPVPTRRVLTSPLGTKVIKGERQGTIKAIDGPKIQVLWEGGKRANWHLADGFLLA
jgi:hypothetical protein